MRQLTARGTITLPKDVIAEIGAGTGTWFEVATDGERIVLTPKELEDRLTEAEWAKLETLLEGPGRAFSSARSAKKHLKTLAE